MRGLGRGNGVAVGTPKFSRPIPDPSPTELGCLQTLVLPSPKLSMSTTENCHASARFQGSWISWDELFQQAATFAAGLGPDRVISISHSADKDNGVVVVWYWNK